MATITQRLKEVFSPTTNSDFFPEAKALHITEKSKAKVMVEEKQFPKGLGVKHPIKMEALEKWYTDDPFCHGIVEKHVDFIMNGGFRIISKEGDDKLTQFLDEHFSEREFQQVLREWIKRALITGNGYLEVFWKDNFPEDYNVLDSKYIYIKMKDKNGAPTNEVEEYQQFINLMATPTPISLNESEIAHLCINKVNDNPYGIGIIHPLGFSLRVKTQLFNDLAEMMSKKANAKTIIKLGDKDKNIIPSADEVTQIGQRLEVERNRTDWVFGPYTDVAALQFGDIGKGFETSMQLVQNELIYGSQIPEVLMGTGNIPEGLAQVQKDAWQFRIRSMQEDIETIINCKILTPLLESNGFDPADAEFEWGSQSPTDFRAEVQMWQTLVSTSQMLSPEFTIECEKKLRQILDFEEISELNKIPQQPGTPREPSMSPFGNNNPFGRKPPAEQPVQKPEDKSQSQQRIKKKTRFLDEHVMPKLREQLLSSNVDSLLSVKEFVRLREDDVSDFLQYVSRYLLSKGFVDREDYSLTDILDVRQINELRNVLMQGFSENETLVKISKNILERVQPGASDTLDEEARSMLITRTETVRTTNEALIDKFTDEGVGMLEFFASPDACPICEDLDGGEYTVEEASGVIPDNTHVNCRCSFLPIRG